MKKPYQIEAQRAVNNYAMYPPSIVRLAPVMNPASSEARYETKPAISDTSAIRPSGIRVFANSACGALMSVAVGPGWTLLTVMARGARSCLHVCAEARQTPLREPSHVHAANLDGGFPSCPAAQLTLHRRS
jgi:hypothetical protein